MVSQVKVSLWHAKRGVWYPPWRGWQPIQRRGFARCIDQIREAAPGPPPRSVVSRMRQYWEYGDNAAGTDLMISALRHAHGRDDSLVECGSGLSTLLFGIYGEAWGMPTFALEQYKPWADEIRSFLSDHAIAGAIVLDAPLRSYDGFEWYSLPEGTPDQIGIVFCDGPPATDVSNQTARYGALPVLRSRIANDGLILLDDALRSGEQEVLARWKAEFGVNVGELNSRRPFVEVKINR